MEINAIKIDQINEEIIDSILEFKLIHDGGLILNLYTEEQCVQIMYNRFISYRFIFESYSMDYLDYNKLSEDAIIYSIDNSTYLEEIREISDNFKIDNGGNKIKHYAILLKDEIFEIITDIHPQIIVSTLKNHE
jgi:hypothetical protein